MIVAPSSTRRAASASMRSLRVSIGTVRPPLACRSRWRRFLIVFASGTSYARARQRADEARATGEDVDVALMHNPVGARELDGVAPVVLCGHMHARAREVLPGGSWLFQQGSTGASGINALRNEDPTPITLTVLYFDDRTGELEAWDDITLGGLGLTSAEIERHLAARFVEDPGEAPSITPAPSSSTVESPS